jgi:hypothetical protein
VVIDGAVTLTGSYNSTLGVAHNSENVLWAYLWECRSCFFLRHWFLMHIVRPGADEEGTLERLKALRHDLVDPKSAEHKGRIVKTTGDGLLVEFASVVDAVRCAVEVQQAMPERDTSVAAQGSPLAGERICVIGAGPVWLSYAACVAEGNGVTSWSKLTWLVAASVLLGHHQCSRMSSARGAASCLCRGDGALVP